MSVFAPPIDTQLRVADFMIANNLPDFWNLWSNAIVPAWWEAGTPGITSWWRDRRVNQDAEGEDFSQHLLGLALDFKKGTPSLPFRRRGFTTIDEADHLHVQTYPASVEIVRRVLQ